MTSRTFAPLAGLTVLELSQRVSGGYCGYLLGALGAQVSRADLPWVGYVPQDVRAVYRQALDRGKTVLRPSAISDLRAIAESADLVVADCLDLPGDADTSRLVSELLGSRSPESALTEITTFGRDGAQAGWTGDSLIASAWTAASWSVGSRAREPLTVPADLPEYLAGTHAAGASIAGLLGPPDRENRTQRVTVTDTLGYIVAMIVTNFIPYGREWHRDGPRATQSGGCYPGAIFECQDGPISVMCRQQREWDALRRAMGSPDWSMQERFQDPRVIARLYADEADQYVKPWVAAHTRSELVQLGGQYGFPVAPIRSVADNLDDTQFTHRDLFEELAVPDAPPVRLAGQPYQVTDGPVPVPGLTPARRTPAAAANGGPLSGLRVLDLTWVWSGPMVTSALSDLGAEVIKIEHASHPDPARARGRGVRDGVELKGPPLELSPYFNQLGHDKQSVSIDLGSPKGRQLILELAKSCDVVIENMRPGVLARQGLGFEALQAVNSSIVLLSMSVMGQNGPASAMMGYGVVMSGLAGLEALSGYPDEITGLFNLALADPNAGSHALVVLLAALHRQRETGRGGWIDLSQTECTVCVLIEPLLEAQLLGDVQRPGNGHPTASPHGHFRTAGEDCWIAVSVHTAEQREALTTLLGAVPEDELDLETRLAARSRVEDAAEFAAQLQRLGVPAAPVNSFDTLLASRWFDERGFRARLDHPYLGAQDISAIPWEIGSFRPIATASSPLLGQHTSAVLGRLGMSPDEIDALAAAGVVVLAPSEGTEALTGHGSRQATGHG
jgi:crotonobetainyl-CoA:carnitine CoA-transferase CaiB-like acyl-CoA transferase